MDECHGTPPTLEFLTVGDVAWLPFCRHLVLVRNNWKVSIFLYPFFVNGKIDKTSKQTARPSPCSLLHPYPLSSPSSFCSSPLPLLSPCLDKKEKKTNKKRTGKKSKKPPTNGTRRSRRQGLPLALPPFPCALRARQALLLRALSSACRQRGQRKNKNRQQE